jgi:capsular polysaccharide biosynthesis protein
VLAHRWWLVLLATGIGLAAGGGWLHTRPLVWESTTSVLVHPVGLDTNVVGGRTRGPVNLDTEAQLVRSTAIADLAAGRLGLDPPPDDLARQIRVQVPPNTSVLTITFTAGTPAGAQAGAQAFAEAYLQHRERSAQADLAAQRTAIQSTLDELGGNLTRLNERLAGAPPGTATAANLDSQRSVLTNQVNALTDRRNELTTAAVSPGLVISEARVPRAPERPRPVVVLASGAALGLAAGAGLAGLADRLARRVRRPADLSRRLGIPVLASFRPRSAPPADDIAAPSGPAGRAFDRLRNEVIAAAPDRPPGRAARGRVVLVVSPVPGPVTGSVAANLAGSLARCGHAAILVEATGPADPGGAARLLAVAAAPGLSELLAGRASLAEVLQRPPRHPRLRVVTNGGAGTGGGLLQPAALRSVLAAATAQADYVVVAAPATTRSADAQSLASHADLALLAVPARRTRLAEVADATSQLQRVGTTLVGAVVVVPQRWWAGRTGRYLPANRDGSGGAASVRPTGSRPRTGRLAGLRLAAEKLPPAPGDGQTLVLARLPDDPGAAGPAGGTDDPRPVTGSELPEQPERS